MNRHRIDYFDLVPVVLLMVAVVGFVAFTVLTPTYADGFCTALGGEKINGRTCNVSGQVVEVQ